MPSDEEIGRVRDTLDVGEGEVSLAEFLTRLENLQHVDRQKAKAAIALLINDGEIEMTTTRGLRRTA